MKYKQIMIAMLLFAGCAKAPPPPPRLPLVTAANVEQRVKVLYNEYVGHIEAKLSVSVRTQIDGILTQKFFMDGQEVKAGDLLYTVDQRPYQAALDKAEAVLAQNLAALKYAQDTVRRYGLLVQDDYVAQLDYDRYVTNMLVDEATIQQNYADIDTAQIELEYCSIYAPCDGVVGKTQKDEGNYVNYVDSTPLVTINQIKPIYINFFIPEKDLPEVKTLHWKCPLKVQAILNENYDNPYTGELQLIDNQVDESTGMILLQANYGNEDKALWPGQYVAVRLILGVKNDALIIPTEAIQYGQQGSYVFVIKEDHTVEVRLVTIGQRDEKEAYITNGLKSGDKIVLEGQLNLVPGAKVEIQEKSEPT